MTLVAVIGSGMMGRGIAACLAAGGAKVSLFDTNAAQLEGGVKAAEAFRDFLVEAKAVPEAAMGKAGSITGVPQLADAVKEAEFIFEAVLEDVAVKQGVFKQVEASCSPTAVLCTNTSSLPVSEIASALATPDRFLAAHFIGPAHLVPLVEVCPAKFTSKESVSKVQAFLAKMGKKPVVMDKEIEGFIAARLQAALYRESMNIVQEGAASKEAVDMAVVNGFGRRLNQIGPFQVADFAGIDLVKGTHGRFFPQLGSQQSDVLAEGLVAEGRLGAKVGHGHYQWEEESRTAVTERRDAELLRRLQADFC